MLDEVKVERARTATAGRAHIRFVTATSLFDGHDAAINIMRRMLQPAGVEVIHLGHNRSVDEIVTAAIQEDVQGIAISSYQGGHLEYFKYVVDLLARARRGTHQASSAAAAASSSATEIAELQAYGVERIYSPDDGQRLGLEGMIADMMARADFDPARRSAGLDSTTLAGAALAVVWRALSTRPGERHAPPAMTAEIAARARSRKMPVLGVTGTGGSGKSSLCDELIRRFRLDRPDMSIAVVAIDPSRRRAAARCWATASV